MEIDSIKPVMKSIRDAWWTIFCSNFAVPKLMLISEMQNTIQKISVPIHTSPKKGKAEKFPLPLPFSPLLWT